MSQECHLNRLIVATLMAQSLLTANSKAIRDHQLNVITDAMSPIGSFLIVMTDGMGNTFKENWSQ